MIETYIISAGVLIIAGRWADKKSLDYHIAVGLVVLIIMLTLLANADENLAEKFALIILIGAALGNVISISKALGFTK